MPPELVSHQRIVCFDKFEVDMQAGILRKRGTKVMLRDQPFAVLSLLLERPGQLVTREELRNRLWPQDVFVEFDNLLNTAVARLREALGDSADHPRFIETLPKRGYRFIGTLSEPAGPGCQLPAKLAVLPFVNMSGDAAQEYFCDPITDEVITALAALAPRELAVIARTTTMHYKGSDKDASTVGRELGVEYLVEGGVHRERDHLSINVQLIHVTDQMHLFARKYDAEMHDIFKVMSLAALDVAESIGIKPEPGNRRGDLAAHAHREPTKDMKAYNEYILAHHVMGPGTAAAIEKSMKLLESAIARDPDFAPAYDALAEMYWFMGYFGSLPPRKAFSIGIVHALRALEIDSTRAETHALLGQFHKITEYNWTEVEREMTLARRLDAASPRVRLRYAVSWLMPHGHVREAVGEVESALQLDPLYMMGWSWLGVLLALQYQQDGAAATAERALTAGQRLLELYPTTWAAYITPGTIHRERRDFEQAIAAYRMAVERSGGLPFTIGCLGLTLGLSGNAGEARYLLERLHATAEKQYVPPSSFAWIHLGLGEADEAFDWLNRAVDECDQYMMPIKTYGFFDPLRSDPRFLALLRKMNLEP